MSTHDFNNTWDGALSFYLPCVVESYGAVRMRVGQKSLTKAVHPLVQFFRNVGCLEYQQTHKKITANTGKEGNFKHVCYFYTQPKLLH